METKKLTAKDLMIWDYMKYKDGTIVQIARVGDVSPMDAPIYCYTQLEGYFPCELADLAPIPLTAENLMRNGFIKGIFGTYRLPNTTLAVEIDAYGLMFLRFQNCQICEIKSVSHLQHLMRDLGITNEIVL